MLDPRQIEAPPFPAIQIPFRHCPCRRRQLFQESSLPNEVVYEKEKNGVMWLKELNAPLEVVHLEIADIIELKKAQQWKGLEMIPSDNFTSLSVMRAVGSVMTNKYNDAINVFGYAFVDNFHRYCTDALRLEIKIKGFQQPEIFEFDHVHPESSSGSPTAILYAALGAECFKEFHLALSEEARKGQVKYVVRSVLPSGCESKSAPCGVIGAGTPLNLAGYGVELALKNMEYRLWMISQ